MNAVASEFQPNTHRHCCGYAVNSTLNLPSIMSLFTPDSQLELLFASEIIPTSVKEQLGADLHVCFS